MLGVGYREIRGFFNNLLGAAYNYNISSSLYLGIGSSFHYDEITDLDYRLGGGPVVGYRLINTDATKLALEAGLGYIFEKQDGIKSGYLSFNAAQRFSHTLAGGSKITEGVTFSAEAEDFENFLLTADISLEVPFSAHWAFKATVGTVFDNTPSAGQKENDLFALAGLSYSAQGFAPTAPGAVPPCSPNVLQPPRKKRAGRTSAEQDSPSPMATATPSWAPSTMTPRSAVPPMKYSMVSAVPTAKWETLLALKMPVLPLITIRSSATHFTQVLVPASSTTTWLVWTTASLLLPCWVRIW